MKMQPTLDAVVETASFCSFDDSVTQLLQHTVPMISKAA